VVATATIGSFVKTGELRALAAWTKDRLPEYQDVPTLKELGLGDLMHENWMMLLTPANTLQTS